MVPGQVWAVSGLFWFGVFGPCASRRLVVRRRADLPRRVPLLQRAGDSELLCRLPPRLVPAVRWFAHPGLLLSKKKNEAVRRNGAGGGACAATRRRRSGGALRRTCRGFGTTISASASPRPPSEVVGPCLPSCEPTILTLLFLMLTFFQSLINWIQTLFNIAKHLLKTNRSIQS